jgi:PAS domain S-box-containing protein
LHIIADPIVDDNGILTGFITIQTDITERKKTEEQQLQKLSMVASKTTNAVVITDAEYRITWVNEGYTRLTEYSLDEVRGEEPECSAQESQIDQLVMERMRSAVAKRISFEGEVMNYAKNGRLYWVHIKTDPFFDDDGTLAGFVSIKTDITERKQAEQLLKDSEERYRLIFENSNEGMIQTHPDGKIEAVNSAACSIFGRSKEELSRMSRANIVDMNDPRLPAILKERDRAGYVQGELNFVRGDGTKFPGEFSSSIYVDSKSEQHIIVFLKDVSERKQAEKALRQSEGNLRALFESSIQAYYLIDINYTVLSFNKVARDLVKSYFGRTLAIGDSILGYTIPDVFMRNFHRALQGEWVTDDGVAQFPNNQRRFFEAIYSPVYDDKNELIGISYNMLDITERKELQTQVIEYNARLQSIIESMMDGVILLNEQRTISLINPAAEAIFGYASEELFSQPITLLLPDGTQELHNQHIESFLHNTQPDTPHYKSHIVKKGRHKSGHVFPMEASIAHFTVEGRLFLLAVVRDITKRLETEKEILDLNRTLTQRVEERTAQLVKLNKEKDEFLGIAAHDLKNPLAAIRSSAQIIEECFVSGEAIDFAEYTDSIIATSDEMLDIITNFLDIELIENGKLGLALERIPHTIVQKAVTSHQRRARAKDITIHYEESIVPMTIIADKLAFRQVLDNLLSNAVKFSPRSKHIYVRIQERQVPEEQNTSSDTLQDHYLRIEIQDEGPGIGIEEQERLFTKFSRLSAKPTGEESSTGLGLSIVKKLVEMMNGRVWCESVKGEGATFIVEFSIINERL